MKPDLPGWMRRSLIDGFALAEAVAHEPAVEFGRAHPGLAIWRMAPAGALFFGQACQRRSPNSIMLPKGMS